MRTMPSSVAMFFMMDQLSLLRPGGDNNRATGQHVTFVRCMWAHDRMAHMRQPPTKVPLRTLLRVQLYREGGPGGPEESSDHLRKLGEVGC